VAASSASSTAHNIVQCWAVKTRMREFVFSCERSALVIITSPSPLTQRSAAERQEWVDACIGNERGCCCRSGSAVMFPSLTFSLTMNCIANSSMPVQEAQHRKLLWTAEQVRNARVHFPPCLNAQYRQVRKELESSVGARSASPKNVGKLILVEM
jgi:hypothetical protein